MESNEGPAGLRQKSKFHFDNMHWKDPILYGLILLYQVGDLSCEGGYTTGVHEQFCYELSLIVSGKGVFSTNEAKYNVKKGDVYLSLPGELHNVVADRIDPVRYFYVAFSLADFCCETDSLGIILGSFGKVQNPVAQDNYDLHTIFINIFSELINCNEYSDLVISSLLTQLIIMAYRDYCQEAQTEYSPRLSMEHTKQVVYEVVNYIDAKLWQIVDLPDLCSKFGYSYSYLAHLFSREMGQSMQEYYDRKRFETAAHLLVSGNMSVTEISEKLCYQTIHSFSRAFKLFFGMSPSQYKTEHKKA